MPMLYLNKCISSVFSVFIINICKQQVTLYKLCWPFEDNLEFHDFKANFSLIKQFIRRFITFIYAHVSGVICYFP
jgi:hypothetical protein